MPSHPVVPCPHALSTPPAPRFVNPPPGLFRLRRCLGHRTRLSTAQCKFVFFIVLPLLTPASLSLRAASPPSCCVPSLMLRPLPHAASPPSCHVCSLVLHPFSHATSSPPPALHQPPFPWPIPAASTSRPLHTVSDASVIVDPPPLHTVLCTRCAPTPFSALTSPYACVCACSYVIVHLLLYMY